MEGRNQPVSSEPEPRSPYERATPWTLALLGALFVVLTGFVHTDPGQTPQPAPTAAAMRGRDVWRARSCQTCHQVYGLGGFQGPDLTNVVSLRGEGFVRVAARYGIGDMPAQDLRDDELDDLVAYLKTLDATGHYAQHDWPPRSLHE